MKVFIGERRSGKTSELIKIAAENGGYIVCRSREMASEINSMAHKMGLSIAFPITYGEFLDVKYYGLGVSKFYIDDADALLQSLTVVPIEMITLTEESKNATTN